MEYEIRVNGKRFAELSNEEYKRLWKEVLTDGRTWAKTGTELAIKASTYITLALRGVAYAGGLAASIAIAWAPAIQQTLQGADAAAAARDLQSAGVSLFGMCALVLGALVVTAKARGLYELVRKGFEAEFFRRLMELKTLPPYKKIEVRSPALQPQTEGK